MRLDLVHQTLRTGTERSCTYQEPLLHPGAAYRATPFGRYYFWSLLRKIVSNITRIPVNARSQNRYHLLRGRDSPPMKSLDIALKCSWSGME